MPDQTFVVVPFTFTVPALIFVVKDFILFCFIHCHIYCMLRSINDF